MPTIPRAASKDLLPLDAPDASEALARRTLAKHSAGQSSDRDPTLLLMYGFTNFGAISFARYPFDCGNRAQ